MGATDKKRPRPTGAELRALRDQGPVIAGLQHLADELPTHGGYSFIGMSTAFEGVIPRGTSIAAILYPTGDPRWWWTGVFRDGLVTSYGVALPVEGIPLSLPHLGVPEVRSFVGKPSQLRDADPFCVGAHGRRRIDARSVYFVQPIAGGLIKIGVARNVLSRLATLQTGSPAELVLRGVIPNSDERVEAELHRRFAAARRHGEWFEPVPELLQLITECRYEVTA